MSASAGGAAFRVLVYSNEVLEAELCNAHVELERIRGKLQVSYLEEYLHEIGASTIVVEHDYIDRDYMEDFAAYYVRCFVQYDRRCKRLHFFSRPFSEQEFRDLISARKGTLPQNKFTESYLGFIAVKPLPETVIGRTCLVTYPDEGTRHYEIVRDYEANLFGIPLKVRSTLAFQEQDKVVAACASSALWSAFHGTSQEFRHRLPSPAEITQAAGAKASDVDRNLPNKGLTWNMMADAIRYVGLEPLYSRPADENDLKAMIYGYVRGRIPAILGFNRHDPADDPDEWRTQGHAVTVSGFRLDPMTTKPVEDTLGFRLYAYRMDRLFVHDDQIGPFARMFIDSKPASVNIDGKTKDLLSLGTLYPDSNDEQGNVRGVDLVVLLP
ncbi:MAG: hypothetical protein OEV08_14780, partial [Nitrospira sp.]|nr:hypothetical protein [Nitrospira sp.]